MSTATVQTQALSLRERLETMPRVNLLPPEVLAAGRVRRLRAIGAVAGVAAAGVVGMLYLSASADAAAAQDELTVAQATGAQLQGQIAEFAYVPEVYAQVAAAETGLTQAMGQEVRFSYLLNDVSLTIPSRVWLTELSVEQPLLNVDAQGVTSGEGVTGAYGSPGIAKASYNGFALAHNDVAAWLDSLTRDVFYADPTFTESTLEEVEGTGTEAVSYSSEVTVTSDAYSQRYTSKAGQ